MANSLQWSILAGLGTAVGALLIFIKRQWSASSLAFYLGLASGVMTAVVVFDMLPSALVFTGLLRVAGGVALGALIMALANGTLFTRMSSPRTLSGLGYLIMLGIAMHDLPEGMAIALGDAMKTRTGLVIALGIGIHNIPEGMAIAAPLLMAGVKKSVIFLQIMLVTLITPLGAWLGHNLAASVPGILPLLLGVASGIMIYLVFFQLWPQAKLKDQRSRWWGFYLGMLIILAATFM
ncbi:MAG: ZIP family metal transporter [Syntrophomonadaceae bacterium]|nr:ZIP family metal transporter [Syntrophomonadaceae bacterium]